MDQVLKLMSNGTQTGIHHTYPFPVYAGHGVDIDDIRLVTVRVCTAQVYRVKKTYCETILIRRIPAILKICNQHFYSPGTVDIRLLTKKVPTNFNHPSIRFNRICRSFIYKAIPDDIQNLFRNPVFCELLNFYPDFNPVPCPHQFKLNFIKDRITISTLFNITDKKCFKIASTVT